MISTLWNILCCRTKEYEFFLHYEIDGASQIIIRTHHMDLRGHEETFILAELVSIRVALDPRNKVVELTLLNERWV